MAQSHQGPLDEQPSRAGWGGGGGVALLLQTCAIGSQPPPAAKELRHVFKRTNLQNLKRPKKFLMYQFSLKVSTSCTP